MKFANLEKASVLLFERKSEPKENRTAFIAALIMDRTRKAQPADSVELNPYMAQRYAVELVRLAGRIHSLAEADCNYGLNPRQEAESERLQKRFADIADALGFEARTGGDPRGACAYLIDPAKPSEGDGWGNGWAVYA